MSYLGNQRRSPQKARKTRSEKETISAEEFASITDGVIQSIHVACADIAKVVSFEVLWVIHLARDGLLDKSSRTNAERIVSGKIKALTSIRNDMRTALQLVDEINEAMDSLNAFCVADPPVDPEFPVEHVENSIAEAAA